MSNFSSLPQACGYFVGRLEGLAGSTRHEMSDELQAELKELSRQLTDTVKHFDVVSVKKAHSTK